MRRFELHRDVDVSGVSESTVRDPIAAGRIPAVHVGGRIVVSRKALDALLDGRQAS